MAKAMGASVSGTQWVLNKHLSNQHTACAWLVSLPHCLWQLMSSPGLRAASQPYTSALDPGQITQEARPHASVRIHTLGTS